MSYPIGDDEAAVQAVEEALRWRYGGRARQVAERMVRGEQSSEAAPDVAERIKRGPLRSGSAPASRVQPEDPLERDLYKALGIPRW